MFDKGRLYGVKIIWRIQVFNGGDFGFLMYDCKRQVGIKFAIIDQYGIGFVLFVIVIFFGID